MSDRHPLKLGFSYHCSRVHRPHICNKHIMKIGKSRASTKMIRRGFNKMIVC